MPTNDGFQGVSNCYVFKSRLQEYAQKVGVPTPVYETIKEGPSHEPYFRSSVIVNDVRYDSLPGFSNRKAAEQSAAEVALRELSKSGDVNHCISQPVHETGLCKNLLQEYAQKMNYAIPLYQCQKDETPGRATLFSCTIEIGGIRYIGAAAKTKKEAEIKAARTALLAIQSSASDNEQLANAQLTVLPGKKRAAESEAKVEETSSVPKKKKARFKKRTFKNKFAGTKAGQTRVENPGKFDQSMNHDRERPEMEKDASKQITTELATGTMVCSQNGVEMNQSEREKTDHDKEQWEMENDASKQLATETIASSQNGTDQSEREKMDHDRERPEMEKDASKQLATETTLCSLNGVDQSEREKNLTGGSVVPDVDLNPGNGQSTVSDSTQSNCRILPPSLFGDAAPSSNDTSEVSTIEGTVSNTLGSVNQSE